MNVKKLLLLSFFSITTFTVFSQEKGAVEVVKNSAIDSLISRRLLLQKSVSPRNESPLLLYGFRVQVFFGPDRKKAYQEQARVKELYPEYPNYLTYTQPNYRIKVGDFRTRSEAQKLMNQLKPYFSSLFIFNERIHPPKLEDYHVD